MAEVEAFVAPLWELDVVAKVVESGTRASEASAAFEALEMNNQQEPETRVAGSSEETLVVAYAEQAAVDDASGLDVVADAQRIAVASAE